MQYNRIILTIIICLFIHWFTSCITFAPPVFVPSRSLHKTEGTRNINFLLGYTNFILPVPLPCIEVPPCIAGIEIENKISDKANITLNLSGIMESINSNQDISALGIGTGLITFPFREDNNNFSIAMENRLDFLYMSNHSISAQPSIHLHLSYTVPKAEIRFTLRTGYNKILRKGSLIIYEEPGNFLLGGLSSRDEITIEINDNYYYGGDFGLLFHNDSYYIGPVFGLLSIKNSKTEKSSGLLYTILVIGKNTDLKQ